MRDRVGAAGGELQIYSTPGRGTTIIGYSQCRSLKNTANRGASSKDRETTGAGTGRGRPHCHFARASILHER